MDSVRPTLLPVVAVEVPEEGLSIGEASRVTGVGIEALRYYEREGLLLDPAPRNAGGRRRYATNDLAWIAGLVMLRETGMPIANIREMARLSRVPGNEAERLVLLEQHRVRVLAEMERTTGPLDGHRQQDRHLPRDSGSEEVKIHEAIHLS